MYLDIPYKYRLIILFAISFVATMLVFRPILEIAKRKNIVDNPDARKLQKEPIPVMGGVAVFFGIAVGLCFFKTMITYTTLFPILGAMIVMLYIGCMDDVLSLKAGWRFIIEIITSLVMIYGLRSCIANFQGMWGIDVVPLGVALPLSVITFLGVVNSINMIDGVDGLSSAFCILILGCFGIVCFLSHQYSFAVLSAVSIGALLPFFIHNVFGTTTKMFIGDGGTMMMGVAISAMVFVILRKNFSFPTLPQLDFSRIAFVIAVLSVPIADTLRVMTSRMLKRKSPFSPDKTHFHHILINLHFSFISITIIEIVADILTIAVFFLVWKLGASLEVQLYVVIGVAALLNWGGAAFLSRQISEKTKMFENLCRIGRWSHVERKGLWLRIQCWLDQDPQIKGLS